MTNKEEDKLKEYINQALDRLPWYPGVFNNTHIKKKKLTTNAIEIMHQ